MPKVTLTIEGQPESVDEVADAVEETLAETGYELMSRTRPEYFAGGKSKVLLTLEKD